MHVYIETNYNCNDYALVLILNQRKMLFPCKLTLLLQSIQTLTYFFGITVGIVDRLMTV